MLLIDDLIAAPFKGLFWIFSRIHRAAEDELDHRQELTRDELTELYMQLETGRISENEFDAREKALLDRLEEVQKLREAGQAGSRPGESKGEGGE